MTIELRTLRHGYRNDPADSETFKSLPHIQAAVVTVLGQVNMILTVAPYTPDKRGDFTVVRGGVREDVTGSAALMPEINVEELTSDGPGGLVALFAEVSMCPSSCDVSFLLSNLKKAQPTCPRA